MLKPSEILDVARSKWPTVLRSEAAGECLFPLSIPFGRPNPTADFSILRTEIEMLANDQHGWHIQWNEIRTRKWGWQRWPMRITFNSVEDLASALDKSLELTAFRDALKLAREECPPLAPWLIAKAHRIPMYLPIWSGLVSVCAYFDINPKPRCFARQIPISVDTKFIQEHEGILRELLDIVLGSRVNSSGATFEERFHLLAEAPQIRFRFLDQQLQQHMGWPVSDCSVPAPSFAALKWNIPRVLIIENRTVFLCLPNIPKTLAVFGSGKAASLLPPCNWMHGTDLLYWGDCDEAGYGILSSLRGHFRQLRSLLMDENAWGQWKHLAVPGKRDSSARGIYLTPAERAAFIAVQAGPWMLEQERIPAAEAEKSLLAAFS
jgi:hypothetical protein